MVKALVAVAAEIPVMAVLLFATAGTLAWPAAWVFLGIFGVLMVASVFYIGRRDPGLLAERMTLPVQRSQPLWDRLVMVLIILGIVCWLGIAGLDAVRFGWTDMPLALQVAGAVVMTGSFVASVLVMATNSFLSPVVRHQAERGQRVIDTGPYAVVRHPFYAALGPFFLGGSLLLGSWWSALFALLIALVFGLRTIGEEAFLVRELDGYRDYRQRVRFRMIPGIW